MSAVIPAFNAERFLGAAIESVLAQTHRNLECVVVDDGSTDDTGRVAAAYAPQVSYVRQQNAGTAVARNRGASESRGQYIGFLDADDAWHPDRVERQLEEMEKAHAEAALCTCRAVGERAPTGHLVRMRPTHPTLESLLLWRGTLSGTGSSLLVSRRALEKIGGFDTRLSAVEDWEFLTRLVSRVPFVYLDEALVDYRWHDANKTHDLLETESDLRRAYSIILARESDRLRISPRRARGGFHRMLAAANLRLGNRTRGVRHALRAAYCDPAAVGDVLRSRLPSIHSQRD